MYTGGERIVDHVSLEESIVLVLTNFKLYCVNYEKRDDAFLIQKFNFGGNVLNQSMSFCSESGFMTILNLNIESHYSSSADKLITNPMDPKQESNISIF
jgi:hypothetical protein